MHYSKLRISHLSQKFLRKQFISSTKKSCKSVAMYNEFDNKVVIITGSSSGVGEETVIRFSSLGAKVVVTGLDEESRLKSVALKCEEISPHKYKPLTVIADFAKEEDVTKLVNETLKRYGNLHILVNNAAVAKPDRISDQDILAKFDATISVNLRPVVQLCHLCLPHLASVKGCIVNVSSYAAIKPIPNYTSYGIAKAGLDLLTKILAIEYGPQGIRVNSVNPSTMRTPMLERSGLSKEQINEFVAKQASSIPLSRIAEIKDVVDAIVFFASKSADFLTGTTLLIDGGLGLCTLKQ